MNIELTSPGGVVIGKVVFYQEFNEEYKNLDDIEKFIIDNKLIISSNDDWAFCKMSVINSEIDGIADPL